MRKECSTLKKVLVEKFPKSRISISYRETGNVFESRDRIIIRTDIPYDAIEKILSENTTNICIVKSGQVSELINSAATICSIQTDARTIEIADMKNCDKR